MNPALPRPGEGMINRSGSRHDLDRVRPFAIPALLAHGARTADWVYGVRRVDAGGRVINRQVLDTLGWGPGTRLSTSVTDGEALLEPDITGKDRLCRAGDLWLGSRTRRRLGLTAGSQIFMASSPSRCVLLLWTLEALDAIVTAHLGSELGEA